MTKAKETTHEAAPETTVETAEIAGETKAKGKMTRLYNKGQRDIQVKEFTFHPKATVDFPAEVAAKLVRLFPDEIGDQNSSVAEYSDEAVSKSRAKH